MDASKKNKSIFGSFLDSYSKALESHPYLVKILSSGFIGGLGDVLIQLISTKSFDLRRFIVFTSVAAFYIAPVIHVWFNWLSKIPMPASFNNVSKALVMMIVDQTVGASVITAGFFYAFELVSRITCFVSSKFIF